MKVSTQKAIGWVFFAVGLGGAMFLLAAIVTIGERQVKSTLLPWVVGSSVVAVCSLVLLVRAYLREPMRGKKILHLRLSELVVASVLTALVMGLGKAFFGEEHFIAVAVSTVLLCPTLFLTGLALARRKGLVGRWSYVYRLGFVPMALGFLGLGATVLIAVFLVFRSGPRMILELVWAIAVMHEVSPGERHLFEALRVLLIGLPCGLAICFLASRGQAKDAGKDPNRDSAS